MQPLSTSQSHERQELRMQSPPNSTRGPSSKLLAHGKLKIKAIDKVLVTISDAQTWNALGLLIAALVQCNSLSLYHLHIVYDTVSFTGVSVCASLVNLYSHEEGRRRSRMAPSFVFACIFLSFAILFGKKLEKWDETVPGHCYRTRLIASPNASHPIVDRIYLGITFFYAVGSLWICHQRRFILSSQAKRSMSATSLPLQETAASTGGGPQRSHETSQQLHRLPILLLFLHPEVNTWIVTMAALLQYPLHLYTVIAMRASNEKLLNGDSENTWGFGQIVALVLCAATLVECARGVSDYRKDMQPQTNNRLNHPEESELEEVVST